MLNNLLLNPTTLKWINAYIKRPSASLLINSNGDQDTAIKIIESIHKKLVSTKSPLITVFPDKDSITIDQIRSLQHSLSLVADKTKSQITRIAIIHQANLLTNEAQNALLKLIEELPKRTIVCLLADNKNNLLETIISRCFSIEILPIFKEQAIKYADLAGYDKAESQKAYLLSEGNASLFTQYLQNGYTEAEIHINKAKLFVSSSGFVRQEILLELYKDKEALNSFVKYLELISKTALRSANNLKAKQNWRLVYQETIKAKKQLSSNVSPNLALLRLSLEI